MFDSSLASPPPHDPDQRHWNVDLLVVGGGINGAGIARDAAGRGLKVLLCEQGDLAQATSSASSKLIHGGLRYLENYEFRLVREALTEREVLLDIASHIVQPLPFVLPHAPNLRAAWMIRTGLFLYDHLARRSPRLPASRRLRLRQDPVGAPLKNSFRDGFIYSDCRVDDARLVVLNAVDARARGAVILPRWGCTALTHDNDRWRATLTHASGETASVRARILVNAAGPWVETVLGMAARAGKNPAHTNTPPRRRVKLVKGSHIIVPRLYEGEHAYILQNDDRRIVFVIPYQERYSLIGTTDVDFQGNLDDLGQIAISASEIDYLCQAVNRYFRQNVTPGDMTWSYAGVRPLYDDTRGNPSAITRDYVFDITGGDNGEPVLLSIFGGKITTFRKLAEHALAKLAPYLDPAKNQKAWTASAPLPGADLPDANPAAYAATLQTRHPWLPAALARRYSGAYGTLSERILAGAQSLADLGTDFGGGLTEREVRWLVEHEWAMTTDDILWRRTRLGLHVGPETVQQLERWLTAYNREHNGLTTSKQGL